jgi:hypothetical protein
MLSKLQALDLENPHSQYTSFPTADIFTILPTGGTVESVG